jgi:hypothetical protein
MKKHAFTAIADFFERTIAGPGAGSAAPAGKAAATVPLKP